MSGTPQMLLSEITGFFDVSIDQRLLVEKILKCIADFTGYQNAAIYLPNSEQRGGVEVAQNPIPSRVEQMNSFSIPLQTPKGRVVGVLEIQNWNGKAENAANLNLLELLTGLAALAIEYRLEPTSQLNPKIADVVSLDLRRAKENLEKGLIDRALLQTRGNKSQAAKLLGITREGLRKAMKKVA